MYINTEQLSNVSLDQFLSWLAGTDRLAPCLNNPRLKYIFIEHALQGAFRWNHLKRPPLPPEQAAKSVPSFRAALGRASASR